MDNKNNKNENKEYIFDKYLDPTGYSSETHIIFQGENCYNEINDSINKMYDNLDNSEKAKSYDEYIEIMRKQYQMVLDHADLMEKCRLDVIKIIKTRNKIYKKLVFTTKDKETKRRIKHETKQDKIKLNALEKTVKKAIDYDKKLFPIAITECIDELRKYADEMIAKGISFEDGKEEIFKASIMISKL